ncbi:Anthocyanidin 3-O-glucosyltransferase 5 [Linum perenne]
MAKSHVAVLSSPGLGHVTPLFELAKRLVTHFDLRVTFLVITSNIPSPAQDQLLHSQTLPPDLYVVELPPVDASSLVTDDMLLLTQLCVMVKHSLNSSLKSALVEDKPKALIIDIFCTEAFDICKEIHIPVYSFFTASVALMTFSLYLPTMDREIEGQFVDLPEPINVPRCNPIRPEDLLDQVRNRNNDEYKWYLYHVARLPLAAGIFLNSWEGMEPVSVKAVTEHQFYKEIPIPPVFSVGPLIKQVECIPLTDSDLDLLQWLDDQPCESVLFVALGSGGTFTINQLEELALGLEMSEQRFVMVVRLPSDKSSAAFFDVGSGKEEDDPEAYLPKGFTERTKGKGVVVKSWAPQAEVLSHPSTGGFLSHCGWNSTLESVINGVPMIAWPLYAEQRMNATILEEEVGVAVKARARAAAAEEEEVVGREEIEKVVRLVMEGEKGKLMRKKAKLIKESAAKSLSHGGESWESLAKFAQGCKM